MPGTSTAAADDRIREIVQQWYLAEPPLFGAWTTHRLAENISLKTIRVSRGKIEFNPRFIGNLETETLREVMKFEAVRILLKHPYERRKQHTEAAWRASNLAIQECLRGPLPMPFARDVFGSSEYDGKFYEFYYNLMLEQDEESPGKEEEEAEAENGESDRDTAEFAESENGTGSDTGPGEAEAGSGAGSCHGEGDGDGNGDREPAARNPYFEPDLVSNENTEGWAEDALVTERIDEIVEEIEATGNWGSLPGEAQELIAATLKPKLDYRRILHAFRSSIISMQRRLTRMKPSRRYGFDYMGSRRDFCTRVLFAVDVSGSVSSEDVKRAFSIVNRFFKYGVESIDVIWFDTEIRSDEPLRLRKAMPSVVVTGRGGTKFQPVLDYLDENRDYDGLIVFTDGIAPPPKRGRNRHTRVMWLFNREENWKRLANHLGGPGMWSAFVRAD